MKSNQEKVMAALGHSKWSVVCDRALRLIEASNATEIDVYVTQDYHFASRKHTGHLKRFNREYLDHDIIGATAPRKSRVSPRYIHCFVY